MKEKPQETVNPEKEPPPVVAERKVTFSFNESSRPIIKSKGTNESSTDESTTNKEAEETLKEINNMVRKLKQSNKALLKTLIDKMSTIETMHVKNYSVKKQMGEILEVQRRKREKIEAEVQEMEEEQNKLEEEEKQEKQAKTIQGEEDEEEKERRRKQEEEEYVDLLIDPNFNALKYEMEKKLVEDREKRLKEKQKKQLLEQHLDQDQTSSKSDPGLENDGPGIEETINDLNDRFDVLAREAKDKKKRLEMKEPSKIVKAIKQRVVEIRRMKQRYPIKKCAIEKEIYALFQYVHSNDLKVVNAKVRKRVERAEQEVIYEWDFLEMVDKKLKKLAGEIAALTAEYKVLEHRTEQFPQLVKTLTFYSDELHCRQESLRDRKTQVTHLEAVLKDKLCLNANLIEERNKKQTYVTTACETLKECAGLVEKAVQTMNCMPRTSPKSSFYNSHITVPSFLTNVYENSGELSQCSLVNSHEKFENSIVGSQMNPFITFGDTGTSQEKFLTDACGDANDLVYTVFMKLRRVLLISGDASATLNYLMGNMNTTDAKSFDMFQSLLLQFAKH